MARNRHETCAIAHDDVLAFADDLEPGFLQRAHRSHMRNAGNFRHQLNRYFDFAHVRVPQAFVHCQEIFLDRLANISNRFLFALTLRPATRQSRAVHSVSFFRLLKDNRITKTHAISLH